MQMLAQSMKLNHTEIVPFIYNFKFIWFLNARFATFAFLLSFPIIVLQLPGNKIEIN